MPEPEPVVPTMERTERITGIPLYMADPDWLPIHMARDYRQRGDALCGWWLRLNPNAARLMPMEHLDVIYCSLSYGHEGDHVWQNPTPRPVRSVDSRAKGERRNPSIPRAEGRQESVRPSDMTREELFADDG